MPHKPRPENRQGINQLGPLICDAHPRGHTRLRCDLDVGHDGDHYSITDDAWWPDEHLTLGESNAE